MIACDKVTFCRLKCMRGSTSNVSECLQVHGVPQGKWLSFSCHASKSKNKRQMTYQLRNSSYGDNYFCGNSYLKV